MSSKIHSHVTVCNAFLLDWVFTAWRSLFFLTVNEAGIWRCCSAANVSNGSTRLVCSACKSQCCMATGKMFYLWSSVVCLGIPFGKGSIQYCVQTYVLHGCNCDIYIDALINKYATISVHCSFYLWSSLSQVLSRGKNIFLKNW